MLPAKCQSHLSRERDTTNTNTLTHTHMSHNHNRRRMMWYFVTFKTNKRKKQPISGQTFQVSNWQCRPPVGGPPDHVLTAAVKNLPFSDSLVVSLFVFLTLWHFNTQLHKWGLFLRLEIPRGASRERERCKYYLFIMEWREGKQRLEREVESENKMADAA